MKTLTDLIDTELNLLAKRTLAVKMSEKGLSVAQIQEILNVSQTFVNKWIRLYKVGGTEVLRPQYKGKAGFLSEEQKSELIAHLSEQSHYSLEKLQKYTEENYDVVFKSPQSYYDLLSAGGLSWHRTQKENPKKDEAAVSERREEIKKNWNRKKKQ